jgi:hypothetical protein
MYGYKLLASINTGIFWLAEWLRLRAVLVRWVTCARSFRVLSKPCIFFMMFISRSWRSFIMTMLWRCLTVRYVPLTLWFLYYIRLTDKCWVICNKIFTVSFLFFQETSHNVFLVMEVSYILLLFKIIIFWILWLKSKIKLEIVP